MALSAYDHPRWADAGGHTYHHGYRYQGRQPHVEPDYHSRRYWDQYLNPNSYSYINHYVHTYPHSYGNFHAIGYIYSYRYGY